MKLRTGALLAPLTIVLLSACGGSPAPSTSVDATPTGSASVGYRMADVAQHNTQQDCWVAVDDSVYDVTSWISRHPGGPDKILPLCGTNATSAFHGQHGDQEKPNTQLASFRIGALLD